MSSITCPTCNNNYKDIQDHIRKTHPDASYPLATITRLGLVPCTICFRPFKSDHGVKTHLQKIHRLDRRATSAATTRPTTTPRVPTATTGPRTTATETAHRRQHPYQRPQARQQPSDLPTSPCPRPTAIYTTGTIVNQQSSNKRPPQSPEAPTQAPKRARTQRATRTSSADSNANEQRNQSGRSSLSSLPSLSELLRQDPSDAEGEQPGLQPKRARTHSVISISSSGSDTSEQTNQTGWSSPTSLPSLTELLRRDPSDSEDQQPGSQSSTSRQERASSNQAPGSIYTWSGGSSGLLHSASQSPEPTDPQSGQGPSPHTQIAAAIVEKNPSLKQLLDYRTVKPVEKPLHARHAVIFAKTADRAIASYLAHPSDQKLLHILLLPKALSIGLSQDGNGGVGTTLRAFPGILPAPPGGPQPQSPRTDPETDLADARISTEEVLTRAVERASSLLEKGLVGRASRAITSPAAVARSSAETLAALESKHPVGEQNCFNGRTNPPTARHLVDKDVQQALASFAKDTACGLDGWTVPLLKLIVERSSGLKLLTAMTNQISNGQLKGAALLTASRLIPLEKGEKDVRPIAVGSLIYRLAAKAILGAFITRDALLPCQLGVGSKYGVEPAVALINKAVKSGSHRSITSLDLKNAFNSLTRRLIASATARYAPAFYKATRWAYNKPAILVTDKDLLVSTCGVRQGDPLGPLLFSLAIRPVLEDLRTRLEARGIAFSIICYIDDINILSKTGCDEVLDIAEETFAEYGLTLNRKKSFTRRIDEIRDSRDGLKVLGTIVGSLEARRSFLISKIIHFRQILDQLKRLPKQKGLALLRGSIHLLLRHLLRTLDPEGLDDLWQEADELIYSYIRFLRGRETTEARDRDIIALPTRHGGLGIPLFHEAAADTFATASSLAQSELGERGYRTTRPEERGHDPDPPPDPPTLQQLAAGYTAKRLERLDSTTNQAEKKARLENASYLGRKWLDILPTTKPFFIADIEIEAALRIRFLTVSRSGHQTGEEGQSCPKCHNQPTTMLNHGDVCKAAERRWIQRHDAVCNALARSLGHAAETTREPMIEGIATRTDLLITTESSRIYYDVKIAAVNADSAETDPYKTLDRKEAEKVRKHAVLGPSFRPLVFSAGGLTSRKTSIEYKKLQKLAGPTADFMDASLSLVLLRARAKARNSLD
jgi:Reverse transcriptase (RNA-dependent DNA polymerase)